MTKYGRGKFYSFETEIDAEACNISYMFRSSQKYNLFHSGTLIISSFQKAIYFVPIWLWIMSCSSNLCFSLALPLIQNEKSRKRETLNLLKDANSSTNTMYIYVHQICPLGQYGLVVAMSVYMCLFVCVSPSHAILPLEQKRSQGSKAVSHHGINTLKKCYA